MASPSSDLLYSRAVEQLEAARARVRDLEGFVRVYAELMGSVTMPEAPPESAAPPTPPAPPAPPRRPEVSLADSGLSISDAAEKVLRHFGRQMRAREIAATMLEWGFPYENTLHELRASVGGVLSREVREGGIFTRPAHGTFGLKEWGGASLADDEEEEEGEEQGGTDPPEDPSPHLFEENASAGWHRAGEVMR